MRSIIYVTNLLRELSIRNPEYQSVLSHAEALVREIVHLGLISKKNFPVSGSLSEHSTEWLIKEVDGTLHSISLGAVQNQAPQISYSAISLFHAFRGVSPASDFKTTENEEQ